VQLPDLPIGEGLSAIRAALADKHRAVVSAPPGAGKTTIIPLALLDAEWRGDGKIVILEPRRLATRAAARRMADLAGQSVGDLVGYQTRDERHIGPATRIEVLTEGVLTRRLQRDPELPGVAAVLFDEVHERNLPTDLGLALILEVASTVRPDLRILAMSATADTARFAQLLAVGGADAAPVIEVAGRAHPVDVRWLPRQRGDRLENAVERAVALALTENDGDVLVFLPGVGEIMRCRDRLAEVLDSSVDVRPLAGALGVDEQDLALAPSPPGRRRVVLATDIAETSLTVEGVRGVIDSGLVRTPRFDTSTGMTRLTTVSISRDSADQRAGRAGRTEPGVAYRLWSKIEHGSRPAHRAAEITTVDLSGLALEVAAWGTPIERLTFPDPPPQRAWKEGLALLRSLGAIDEDGRLTTIGRRMVELPLHPRLARIVATTQSSSAFVVAALVDERDVLRGRVDELPADLALRVALVAGHVGDERADRRALRRLAERAEDLARRAGARFSPSAVDPDATGRLLLAGFPDRLAARRRGGQFQLRTGTTAFVADNDPLTQAAFIVAVDLDGRRAGARIRLAAAVEAVDIAGILDDVVENRRLTWDRDRDDLVLRIERRLDALTLGDEVRVPTPGDDTVDALVGRVRATNLGGLTWSPAAEQLRARVAFLRRETGGDASPWPDLADRALLATLDSWLRPYLDGATGRADLQRVDVAVLLRAQLPWPLGADLDTLAPASWTLPGGRPVPIDYTADRPTASVRVQDVFGVTAQPTLAGGAVPLTLALLSPADRPIQVTADLPGFWAGSWAEVRKDLAGRYPKHRWPTDPANEPPGRQKPR
jgi:ATP-dependent helicase HrpB